jgi:hypothetical protein
MGAKVRTDTIKPSEKSLIRLWDLIDRTRIECGEQAATQLASAALAAAIAWPKG